MAFAEFWASSAANAESASLWLGLSERPVVEGPHEPFDFGI